MTKLEKLTAWAKVVPVYRDENGNGYFEPVEGYLELVRVLEDWPDVICSWYPAHYFNQPTPEEALAILWKRMSTAPMIEVAS